MIQALVDLSYRLQLTGSQPFALRRVHWFIDLDAEGQFLGVEPTVVLTATQGNWQAVAAGVEIEAPVAYFAMVRPHGVAASGGGGMAVAELGAGNLAETFGIAIQAPPDGHFRAVPLRDQEAYKRTNFLDLHRQLAAASPRNPTIQAAWKFLNAAVEFPVERCSTSQLRKLPLQHLSFRVAGRLLLEDPQLRQWWTREFARRRAMVEEHLPAGRDLFPHSDTDDCRGPLASVFPPIVGIPGSGAWCPLASFDKAPYQSFGLGKGTLPMRLETAERAAAALNWLLQRQASHVWLGPCVALVWSEAAGDRRQPIADEIMNCLTQPDALRAEHLLTSAGRRKRPAAVDDGCLHAAMLSSPQARITVRTWRAAPLSRVRDNLGRWLKSLAVPAPFGEGFYYPSIGELAACTVRKTADSRPLAGTYRVLFESALFGVSRLSNKLLIQALAQQARELAVGRQEMTRAEFERRLSARTALFQVLLQISPDDPQHHAPVNLEINAGYLCGRLLAHLHRIYGLAFPVAGGNDTSPAIQAYAVAFRAPASVLPRLCGLARNHLKIIGGGLVCSLEFGRKDIPGDGLRGIIEQLQESASGFPPALSLEDQARFALGFYQERRRWWERPSAAALMPTAVTKSSEA